MKPPHLTSTQRGTYYADWGTPPELLDKVREITGPIGTDLASSREANETVQAWSYFTPDGLVGPHPNGPIWCNPPGPGKLVHDFWVIWNAMVKPAYTSAFLFFNIDHMRKAVAPRGLCTVVLLEKRQRFVGAPSGASFPSALVFSGDCLVTCMDLGIGHAMLWSP